MCEHVLEVMNHPRHEVSLVIYDAYGFGEKRPIPAFRRLMLKPIYRLINAVAKVIHMWRLRSRHDVAYWRDRRQRLVPAEAIPALARVETLAVTPQRVGKFRYEYPREAVEHIAARCDVLFLAGAGRILAGEILTRVLQGVLSFHPADTEKYKGRPGGFFEWINNEPELGITLQRLNPSLDGGEIVLVRRISLAGEPSMVSAMHSLSLVRRGMLLEGLDVLAGHAGQPLRTPAPTKVNHEKDAETVGNMWRYFIRHVSRCLRTAPLPAENSK
jgi:methionyl-tRNA formyltransferase